MQNIDHNPQLLAEEFAHFAVYRGDGRAYRFGDGVMDSLAQPNALKCVLL